MYDNCPLQWVQEQIEEQYDIDLINCAEEELFWSNFEELKDIYDLTVIDESGNYVTLNVNYRDLVLNIDLYDKLKELIMKIEYPSTVINYSTETESIETFEEYSKEALKTAIYPKGITYPVLGLVGEAGEVTEKVKKIIRDKNGKFDNNDREAIKKELGDVLWYVNAVCKEFDLKLEEVAQVNIEKLQSRQKRGKLGGSGDDR